MRGKWIAVSRLRAQGDEEEALKEGEPTRICRICFEGEGEGEALIAPCQCDGSVPSAALRLVSVVFSSVLRSVGGVSGVFHHCGGLSRCFRRATG